MEIGRRYLVTTEQFFYAPDGEQYQAVFGTLHGILDATSALGIKTNARSTNWYAEIGNMVIAGCQIHYVARTDTCSNRPPLAEWEREGKHFAERCAMSRIYMADEAAGDE